MALHTKGVSGGLCRCDNTSPHTVFGASRLCFVGPINPNHRVPKQRSLYSNTHTGHNRAIHHYQVYVYAREKGDEGFLTKRQCHATHTLKSYPDSAVLDPPSVATRPRRRTRYRDPYTVRIR
jgi:hypothetical protein